MTGPDVGNQLPKHGVGLRNVDVSVLLVEVAKLRHVLELKPPRTCRRPCLAYRDQPSTTLSTLRAVPSVVIRVEVGNEVCLLEVHPFRGRSQRIVADGGRTRCRRKGTTAQDDKGVLRTVRVVPIKGSCGAVEVLLVACDNVLDRLPYVDGFSMNR